MNLKRMAENYIRIAANCLKQARSSLKAKDCALAVRRAQECVEMSLKAILRSMGVEYPKEHDVSKALEVSRGKFPDWFSAKIPKFMEISKDLSKKRGPAMYGYESEMKPSSDIFDEEDANSAISSAKEVFEACRKLIGTPLSAL
jgi:HEPN domain-containing protein